MVPDKEKSNEEASYGVPPVTMDEIKGKLESRKNGLENLAILDAYTKSQLTADMQNDHQKVLMREVKAEGKEKEQWLALRLKIEQQQQHYQTEETILYQKKTKPLAPKQTVIKNVFLAFVVGGAICTVGQIILNTFLANGLLEKEAGAATSAVLVFLGALFTGLGIYDELGKHAGAGSIVPITGFANSIASPALEFKREGFIYGVGARLFTVAGPVIVYGTFVSIIVGLIYFFVK